MASDGLSINFSSPNISPIVMHEVNSKLSPFWSERPALWFVKADALFYVSGISNDETIYNCVISAIDASHAKDLVIKTPTIGSRYEWIKEEILQRFSRSEVRWRQIFDDELGDRRPSQFLRNLKYLLGKDSIDDELLRQLWLRRLPIDVQAILQTQWDLPIEKIAEVADRIMDIKSISVNSAKTQTPSPEFSNLEKKLAELTRQVAALKVQYQHKSNPRNHNSDSSICYYLFRFGSDANKCTQPCSWN